jgi:hypothetical protein
MTTSKILESAYFHISNSGLTIEVVSDEASDGKSSKMHLKFGFRAFGVDTETTVPIFNRDILVQLAAMAQRTLTYLDGKPGMKLHYSETMPACYKISGGQTVEQSSSDGVCASGVTQVVEIPTEVVEIAKTMTRLQPMLGLTAQQIADHLDDAKKLPSAAEKLAAHEPAENVDIHGWVGPTARIADWDPKHPTYLKVRPVDKTEE